MPGKKYDDEELIQHLLQGGSCYSFAKERGLAARAVRKRRERLEAKGVDLSKPIASGTEATPDERRKWLRGKRFVITSAQNNTHVSKPFLESLKQYCKSNSAQLIVSTFTYNKNGFQKSEKDSDGIWYDPSIRDYINNDAAFITDGLSYCGELNILPTAVNPLSGLDNYTNTASAIIPHAKMELKSVATPKQMDARLLYTTGAVTKRNYIQKKEGQKAEHHHSLGACVVEVDKDGDWFVRHIEYDKRKEGFYDLECWYSPDGVEHVRGVEAINFGDIHAAKITPEVSLSMWGSPNSPMEALKPKYVFLHDVHDQMARNHHNVKDPHFLYEMHVKGTESVQDEVKKSAQVIEQFRRPWCEVVVVESNHDLALMRYLKEQDYRKDPVNAIFFLELQLAAYEHVRDFKPFNVFEHACKLYGMDTGGVTFLREDDTFVVAGIENAAHGHLGNNGSRGTINAYVTTGVKYNIGHSHSAGRKNGVCQSGVCVIEQGYNKGNGSHSVSHIVTYENGKRTHITMRGAKWRG